MSKSVRCGRVIAGVTVLCLSAALLGGCGQKEEPPSAQGYYTGPIKSKANSTGGSKKVQGNNNTAAGEP